MSDMRRVEVSNKASKVDGIHTKSYCVQEWLAGGEGCTVESNIAVTTIHTAKLHHVGSFYIYYPNTITKVLLRMWQ